jgi:hypothetical protein
LDPDPIGSADPNPEWESGSGFRQVEIGPRGKEKMRKFMFEESERPMYEFKKTYLTAFDQNNFQIINLQNLSY